MYNRCEISTTANQNRIMNIQACLCNINYRFTVKQAKMKILKAKMSKKRRHLLRHFLNVFPFDMSTFAVLTVNRLSVLHEQAWIFAVRF